MARTAYGAVLKPFAHGVEEHHRYGLGIFPQGKGPDGGQQHEREFVEKVKVADLFARFADDGQGHRQPGGCVEHQSAYGGLHQTEVVTHHADGQQHGRGEGGTQFVPGGLGSGGFMSMMSMLMARAG